MSNLYGISEFDIKIAQFKLENQKNYLKNQTFINSFGEVKSLLDISMSANLSKNYYAEVTNRVNTLSSISIDDGLIPVFLTITLNGCFRDALKGDYSRFTKKDLRYIPAFYKKNGTISKECLAIKDLCYILNYQFHLFNTRFIDKFKGVNRSYIRVFEPHKKDGVPHIHCLFYAPSYTLKYLFETYCDIFNAPQNLRKNAISKEQIANGEINGFQLSINNPVGYVMKYITKTFLDLNKTEQLDELSTWYVKNKVRRILMSRTPIPIWLYRKINFIKGMRDFSMLNTLKFDYESSLMEWNFNGDYIFFSIPETFDELIYEKGHLLYYHHGKLKAEYIKEVKKEFPTPCKVRDKFVMKDKSVKFYPFADIDSIRKRADGKSVYDKSFVEMRDLELIELYKKFVYAKIFETENLQYIANFENELIKRGYGFITGKKSLHNLNDIQAIEQNLYNRELREIPF